MGKVAEIEITRADPWIELPTVKGGGAAFRVSTIKAVTEHSLSIEKCWVWMHGSDGPVSEIALTRAEVSARITEIENQS